MVLYLIPDLTTKMCAEWWSFEITQIIAGILGEVSLATQLITLQLASVAFTMANGIGIGEWKEES